MERKSAHFTGNSFQFVCLFARRIFFFFPTSYFCCCKCPSRMRTHCCRGRRISERAKAASVLACCVPTIVSYEFPFPRRHLVAVLVSERGAARPPNAARPSSPFLTPVSGQNPFTLPALAASFGLCCVVPLPLPTRSDCVSLCGSKRRGSKVAHIFFSRQNIHSFMSHALLETETSTTTTVTPS